MPNQRTLFQSILDLVENIRISTSHTTIHLHRNEIKVNESSSFVNIVAMFSTFPSGMNEQVRNSNRAVEKLNPASMFLPIKSRFSTRSMCIYASCAQTRDGKRRIALDKRRILAGVEANTRPTFAAHLLNTNDARTRVIKSQRQGRRLPTPLPADTNFCRAPLFKLRNERMRCNIRLNALKKSFRLFLPLSPDTNFLPDYAWELFQH